MKTCSKCRAERPVEDFYVAKSGPYKGRLSSACKPCQIERSRLKYHADPVAAKLALKDCRRRRGHLWVAYGPALRKRILAEYGGKCACCGEATQEFLGIDHTRNDGESHRAELKKELGGYGRSIYRWLEMNGYPKDGFQLLCHNCNMSKGLYGGCPHKGPVPGKRQATTRWTKSPTPAVGAAA